MELRLKKRLKMLGTKPTLLFDHTLTGNRVPLSLKVFCMKKTILISAIVLLVILLVLFLSWPDAVSGYAEATVVLPDGTEITVEVADTDEERRQGLSNRTDLGEYDGMLFVYDKADDRSVWMKDMLFSLDVIWLNQGEIVGWAAGLSASSSHEPPRSASPAPADAFLEVPAGFIQAYGLQTGDQLDIIIQE